MNETSRGVQSELTSSAASGEPTGQSLRKVDALVEIINNLSGEVELDELLLLIAVRTSEVMDSERTTIYLVDESAGELWSKVAQGLGGLEIRLKKGQGLAGHAWETGSTVISDDAYGDPRFDPQFDAVTGWVTRDVLATPMRDQGRIIGVIQSMNCRRRNFSVKDGELLAGLASAAAVAVETARLRAQVTHDFLTGLLNTAAFEELYQRELLKARRHCRPIAVIKLEVDGLGAINEDHGREVGDDVLKTVALLMSKSLRGTDVLARYGGDEFVALLPETDDQGATLCVDRLKGMIAKFNYVNALPVPISIRVGIAGASSEYDDLLGQADRAMRASKGLPPEPQPAERAG